MAFRVNGFSQIKNGIFEEPFFDDVMYENLVGYKVEEILFHGQSNYQDILIFKTEQFGTILAIDGIIQLTTSDEFGYHEMLAFLTLTCHKQPKKVLIVGGGDGGLAKQVLKYPTVQSVIVCDIDKMVVDSCRKYIPELASSFDHPKCELIINDAFEYLKECDQGSFDVILCDSTDSLDSSPISERLFGEEFYCNVNKALTKDGLMCTQSCNNMWQYQEEAKGLLDMTLKIFPVAKMTFISIPSFACCQNGVILCSKDKNQDLTLPYQTFTDEELDKMEMRYYDTNIHQTCFTLPRFFQKEKGTSTDVGVKNQVLKGMNSSRSFCCDTQKRKLEEDRETKQQQETIEWKLRK